MDGRMDGRNQGRMDGSNQEDESKMDYEMDRGGKRDKEMKGSKGIEQRRRRMDPEKGSRRERRGKRDLRRRKRDRRRRIDGWKDGWNKMEGSRREKG